MSNSGMLIGPGGEFSGGSKYGAGEVSMGDKSKSQTKHNRDKQAPAKKALAVSNQPAQPAPEQPTPDQKGGGKGIAIVAIIIALGAAGLGYKSWEATNKLNLQLADQGGLIETSISSALKPAIDSVGTVQSDIGSVQSTINTIQGEIDNLKNELISLKGDFSTIKGGVATLESAQQSGLGDINTNLGEQIQNVQSLHGSLEEQQKSLQDNVNALNEGLSTLKSEVQAEAEKDKMSAWVLAEVEYLLHIANSRLNLEHDVEAALTALSAAAKKLSELNLPDLAEIQQLLHSEIEALDSVPKLNLPEMAQTLTTLGSNIEQLPLAKPSEATLVNGKSADSERKQWEILADQVWTALKPLVTVRNSKDPAMAPLTPEKQTYLTQNLQLKIESARLALLRADNTIFHENLKIVNEWVSQFYDIDSTEGASMISTLDELQQATIDTELPDISGSLSALQKFIASKSLKVSGASNKARSTLILASTTPNNVFTDAEIH